VNLKTVLLLFNLYCCYNAAAQFSIKHRKTKSFRYAVIYPFIYYTQFNTLYISLCMCTKCLVAKYSETHFCQLIKYTKPDRIRIRMGKQSCFGKTQERERKIIQNTEFNFDVKIAILWNMMKNEQNWSKHNRKFSIIIK
jgi:hypothetical protein